MILPLPIAQGAGENALEFISLKEYAKFFDDLLSGFPVPITKGGRGVFSAASESANSLVVHAVGNFEASFVPTLNDFSRLDKRFQIPPSSWAKLPQYKTYGFAVFKLKAGEQDVHPMAFSFPRSDASKLFFPTVHIHDGEVHTTAEFDHVLYAQGHPPESLDFHGWRESERSAKNFMKIAQSKNIISSDEHCYQKMLIGNLPNKDTWLARF
ncbi:MAG: hypothetical protein ABIR24_04400 [Verrucomicrobiota bacterium]